MYERWSAYRAYFMHNIQNGIFFSVKMLSVYAAAQTSVHSNIATVVATDGAYMLTIAEKQSFIRTANLELITEQR